MTVLAMTLGDEEIQGLADSLMQIHAEVVRGKGLDLSRVVSSRGQGKRGQGKIGY